MLLYSSETKSNKDLELSKIRKIPVSKLFSEIWYRPRKKSDQAETYYQKMQREKGVI